jgi:hypothetical protein
MIMRLYAGTLVGVVLLLQAGPTIAQQTTADDEIDEPHKIGYRTGDKGISGPASVQSQLDEDDILKDPALNPNDDTVWVWSLRFRWTL